MRKLLLLPILAALTMTLACESGVPVGPGVVVITETTTSTTTSTTTTSTIPLATTASFTFSPLTPEVNQLVFFNASGSRPGTGRRIVNYLWDFGDGIKKSGLDRIETTHDFFPVGIYLVTLTVVDDAGTMATSSQPITIRPVVP
jgi:PKD repeat protein